MEHKHRSISLADQIFERLEQDILIGKYSRGEILTELKLSEELGVSRTPIREALRRLSQERIIEDVSKGSRVLGISPDDLEDIFRSMDSRFHELLYKFSGSNIFSDVLYQLHHKTHKYRTVAVSKHSSAEESLAEHKQIFEAIAAGDSDLAAKVTTKHIENARERILKIRE